MLSVRLQKRRGAFALDVAFDAPTPGVVALFGRSGAGKTTIVDLIAGLLRPDSGRVEIDGQILFDSGRIEVPAEKRGIGYVFQEPRLFPHLRVLGNLRYGQRRSRARAQRIELDEIVELLGLRPLLGRRPAELSGGERQRVAIGRALLSQPRLLLLDEPLAAVDRARRQEVLPYLERLRDRLRVPMVYVSHQFDEVLRLATHVVLLEGGRVAAHGELASVTRDPTLRALLGPEVAGVVVEAEVEQVDAGEGRAWVCIGGARLGLRANGATPGQKLRLHLLASDLLVATEEPRGIAASGTLTGIVSALGEESPGVLLVEVDVAGVRLLARVGGDRARELGLATGRRVWLVVHRLGRGDGLPAVSV